MKHSSCSPELNSPTDIELITAVAQDRSAKALEALYNRYRPMLSSVINRVMNNNSEADEVLQDVFIQVWDLAGSYSAEKGHVLGWLITIARRRALDHIRKLCAYKNATDRYEKAVEPAKPTAGELFVVDREVCQKELQLRVQEQLDKLPEAQREAVRLTFFQGLSQREIAARLSVPLGTVKTRIELGMRKLGRSLAFEKAA